MHYCLILVVHTIRHTRLYQIINYVLTFALNIFLNFTLRMGMNFICITTTQKLI